jgi:membrane-associated protease RseP (regulator of RpoE activity)
MSVGALLWTSSCGASAARYELLVSMQKPPAAKPVDCDFRLVNLPPKGDFVEVGMLTHVAGSRQSDPKPFKESIRKDVCGAGGDIVLTQVNNEGEFVRGTILYTAQSAPEQEKSKLEQELDKGIRSIGENTFEIDKALVDKVLADPMSYAKSSGRVVPGIRDGKSDGIVFYAIRPNSLFAKLGLANGDRIHAINGIDLSSADKALEVYTKLREAASLQLSITRRGKPTELTYTIK